MLRDAGCTASSVGRCSPIGDEQASVRVAQNTEMANPTPERTRLRTLGYGWPHSGAGRSQGIAWALSALCLTLGVVTHCRPTADTSAPNSRPTGSAGTAQAPTSDGATAVTARAITSASGRESQLAGRWYARFTVQPGSVRLPAGVHYPAWTDPHAGAHTGTADTGTAELRLLVDGAGDATGAVTGALGKLTVRGKVEEGELRVGLRPAANSTDPPMYGVLVGALHGGHIAGRLRASSGDGELVRQARVILEPAAPDLGER